MTRAEILRDTEAAGKLAAVAGTAVLAFERDLVADGARRQAWLKGYLGVLVARKQRISAEKSEGRVVSRVTRTLKIEALCRENAVFTDFEDELLQIGRRLKLEYGILAALIGRSDQACRNRAGRIGASEPHSRKPRREAAA